MLTEQQLLGMDVFPSDLFLEAGQFGVELKAFPWALYILPY